MPTTKTIRWLNIMSILGRAGTALSVEQIQARLKALPDGVDVHLRSVQRDLAELRDSGLLALLDETRDGRSWWRIDPAHRAFRNYDHLSLSAALTLKMAIEHALPLLPLAAQVDLQQQVQHVNQRLASELNAWERPWSDKVRVLPAGHQLAPPAVDPSVIEAVYGALAGDWQLWARYDAAYADVSERVYHPLGLVLRPPRLQLVVWSGARDPYVLSLHRIRSARVIEQRLQQPPGFDLDAYIASGEMDVRHGGPIRLRLRCTESLAKHWRDAWLGAEQTISADDDGPVVEATCTDTAALRAYLLGLGSQIEVLAPVEVREWLGNEARRLARAYRRRDG